VVFEKIIIVLVFVFKPNFEHMYPMGLKDVVVQIFDFWTKNNQHSIRLKKNYKILATIEVQIAHKTLVCTQRCKVKPNSLK